MRELPNLYLILYPIIFIQSLNTNVENFKDSLSYHEILSNI